MMGGQIESKKVWTVRPPPSALNPVGIRPGGIFRNVWNFPAFFGEAAADWWHPFFVVKQEMELFPD